MTIRVSGFVIRPIVWRDVCENNPMPQVLGREPLPGVAPLLPPVGGVVSETASARESERE